MDGRRLDTRAFTIVVAVVSGLGALVMLGILVLSDSPRALMVGTILAALPVAPLVACYLWLDRYEPEPRRLLVGGLVWGGFAATGIAVVLQLLARLGGVSQSTLISVVAPLTEELTKGLFLLLLLWWRRAELDGLLDGLVYAGMVGIGFAFVENILYLSGAYSGSLGGPDGPSGTEAVTMVFVMRCLASPFAHPMFTAFTGLGVGIAVGSRHRAVRFAAPLVGYALAVTAHATWNHAALDGPRSVLLAYLVLFTPLFLTFVAFAVWARSSERRMLGAALTDASRRGLIPATDIGWVVDLGARRRSRLYARQLGGEAGERAMRDYQQAAVELGFLHSRYLRGTAPPDFAARGQQYLQRINAIRPQIAFPGQVVPLR